MTEISLLDHLEDIAHRMGVELRYENLNNVPFRCDGGYCRVGGRHVILVNRKDSRRRKISVLARSLRRMDLEGIFIPPAVRKVIEAQSA